MEYTGNALMTNNYLAMHVLKTQAINIFLNICVWLLSKAIGLFWLRMSVIRTIYRRHL